jgi:hypothetical protein
MFHNSFTSFLQIFFILQRDWNKYTYLYNIQIYILVTYSIWNSIKVNVSNVKVKVSSNKKSIYDATTVKMITTHNVTYANVAVMLQRILCVTPVTVTATYIIML